MNQATALKTPVNGSMSVNAIYRQLAFPSRPTYDGTICSTAAQGRFMSRKELEVLVCRAFALFLIAWAFDEVTYLPERLFALSHHLNQSSVLVAHDYWSSYYLIVTAFLVLRILAFFVAAALFWRCGPRVEALFSPPQQNQAALE
jgi:hypothetical protein